MVLSFRYKPDIVLHKKPLMLITCKTSYGKQFRGYRAKGCKEFIFVFGEIKVKLKAAACELSRFLSQFSAKYINVRYDMNFSITSF